jgi:hypothetical protein
MRKNIFSSPVLLLKTAASLLYIIIGLILVIKPETLTILDKFWSRMLGILLLVYGTFRTIRLRNEAKKNDSSL